MRAEWGSGRDLCLYIVRCMLGGMRDWQCQFLMLDQSSLLSSY